MSTRARVQLKCDGTLWRREGKWRGNWRMKWVTSTLHTTSEHGVSSITTADAHTSAASSRLNWRPPAGLNGLVRFAERRNLVSARVPFHFKRNLSPGGKDGRCLGLSTLPYSYADCLGIPRVLTSRSPQVLSRPEQDYFTFTHNGVIYSVKLSSNLALGKLL